MNVIYCMVFFVPFTYHHLMRFFVFPMCRDTSDRKGIQMCYFFLHCLFISCDSHFYIYISDSQSKMHISTHKNRGCNDWKILLLLIIKNLPIHAWNGCQDGRAVITCAKILHDIVILLCMILFLTLFFQFALVHYFTKVGAGEYYLQELEETVCMEEERRRRKSLKLETDDNAQQDSVRLPLYVHLMLYLFFQVLRKSWVLVCFPFYLKELRSKLILF